MVVCNGACPRLQTLASCYLSGSKMFCNTNQKLRVFTLKVKFVLTFFKRRNIYFEDKWSPFPVCVSVFTAQRVAGKCLQTSRHVPCELRLLANSAITRTYLQRNYFRVTHVTGAFTIIEMVTAVNLQQQLTNRLVNAYFSFTGCQIVTM